MQQGLSNPHASSGAKRRCQPLVGAPKFGDWVTLYRASQWRLIKKLNPTRYNSAASIAATLRIVLAERGHSKEQHIFCMIGPTAIKKKLASSQNTKTPSGHARRTINRRISDSPLELISWASLQIQRRTRASIDKLIEAVNRTYFFI